MNRLLLVFSFFIAAICSHSLLAQTKIILRNTPEQAIEIKWYSQTLFYKGGVNVYRQTVGQSNWEKLNDSLIVNGKTDKEIEEDEDLSFWQDVVKQGDPNNLPPLLYVQMLSKSFLEPSFADFLGIRFLDHTAVQGESYQYRIKQFIKGRELTVASSHTFKAAPYQAVNSPKGLEAVQKRNLISLNWEVEELRFFAYHVYRASAIDNDWVQVNRDPVIISLEKNEFGKEVYPDVKYRDDSLQINIAYRYYIQGVDYFGDTSLKSEPFMLTFGDSIPPLPAVGLKLANLDAKNLRVSLTWLNQYSEDMIGVQVYRSRFSDGPFQALSEKVLKKETETYLDNVPEPGGYYYYVATIDGSGNQTNSHPIFVEIKDVIPPKTPQNLKIVADTGKMTLSWDANTEADFAGYRIIRTIKGADDSYVPINAQLIRENTYTDELLKNAKNTFLYKVIAIDTLLNASKPSRSVGASMPDVTLPESPLLKEVREKEGALVITWTPSADIDIEGYELYRSVDDTNYFKKHNLNTLDAHLFRYIDRRTKYQHEYFYRLKAIDESGNESPYSKIISGQLDQAKQKVAGAKNIRLKRLKRHRQVRLLWEAPKVKAELKGYIVMRREKDTDFIPVSGMLSGELVFVDNVSSDKTYLYQIRTYYPTGQYVYSDEYMSEGKKSKKK